MMSVKSKNIYVLPTDKETRLHNTFGILRLEKEYDASPCNQNIHITSDVVDINENDYIITQDGRLVQVSYLLSKDLEGASKVILTTDQDLIDDGIQAIDDEFLEWFVKNPSFERVDIKKLLYKVGSNYQGNRFDGYKIIIPKEEIKRKIDTCYNFDREIGCVQDICRCEQEEPKQDLEKEMFELEQGLDIPSNLRWHNSKPKQDNKMYSEEDMIAFGKSCFYKGFDKAENDDANCYTAFREEIGNLFKQFKNK